MADDKQDKESQTEEPTQHKIDKAIKKGNLPVSKDFSLFANLVSFSIIGFFIVYPSFAKLSEVLINFFDRPEDWPLNNSEDAKHLFFLLAIAIGKALAPIFIIISILGVGSFMVQNPPRFIIERIRPKASRISFSQGLQRVWSKTGFIEFLKSVFKLIGATLITYLILFRNHTLFSDAFALAPSNLLELVRIEICRLLVAYCIATAILAGFDLAWSRIRWRSDLKMTRYEVKQEHKDLEGDPLVKARMQSLARDRIRRQMMANVPKATLIVANPTHFSVALRYNPPQDMAPVVIAKGQNLLALKIREIALEHDIPVIENVALARALYKQVDINQIIPQEFYQAVAELIRYINNN